MPKLNPGDYYRLPWNLNDNVLAWLEPTKRCNLYCEGCYSRNDPKSDKTLEQIRADLEVFRRNRRIDSVSIAGGDPLVHPDIVEIVRMVRHDFGYKPMINTNALALTPELVRDLKRAGLFGFTLHIDSSQRRAGHQDHTEASLNNLRLHYAEMVAAEGDISVAFNATIFRHTLCDVPVMMDWAHQHIDVVHGMVFVLFRTTRAAEHDYFAGGQPVDVEKPIYFGQARNPSPIMADEVVATIRERHPEFEPSSYLGGTHDPQSLKWIVSVRVGTKDRIHGYFGPRFTEALQSGHHLLFGRYMAYVNPKSLQHGRGTAAVLAPFDPGALRAANGYLRSVIENPRVLLQRMHMQTVIIIQPVDFLADGSANMCDGCPDMTVHDGQLVWSCRLDERMEHGCWLTAAPRGDCVGLPGASRRRCDSGLPGAKIPSVVPVVPAVPRTDPPSNR